jgi:hypothetical protein
MNMNTQSVRATGNPDFKKSLNFFFFFFSPSGSDRTRVPVPPPLLVGNWTITVYPEYSKRPIRQEGEGGFSVSTYCETQFQSKRQGHACKGGRELYNAMIKQGLRAPSSCHGACHCCCRLAALHCNVTLVIVCRSAVQCVRDVCVRVRVFTLIYTFTGAHPIHSIMIQPSHWQLEPRGTGHASDEPGTVR